jgi:heptosyltransferase II
LSNKDDILICGVNWLGDSCMSMPAIQAWKALHPAAQLHLLVKPHLMPLWQCHAAIDEIIPLAPGNMGPLRTGRQLRDMSIGTAFIFPNSWRAALPALIAGIPVRQGFPGHFRAKLLTRVIPPPKDMTMHQQWEYARILGLPADTHLPFPALRLPPPPQELISAAAGKPVIGILPGAARGPAKRWPTGHFMAAARKLIAEEACHIAVMGTRTEEALCREIATALSPHASCLAGSTTLPGLAATLQFCKGVLSNDSGGMHLAAAVGTPVVAMFGLTNPAQTGPVGPHTRCLQPPGIQGTRRIARNSTEAQQVLESIAPEDAATALCELMEAKGATT